MWEKLLWVTHRRKLFLFLYIIHTVIFIIAVGGYIIWLSMMWLFRFFIRIFIIYHLGAILRPIFITIRLLFVALFFFCRANFLFQRTFKCDNSTLFSYNYLRVICGELLIVWMSPTPLFMFSEYIGTHFFDYFYDLWQNFLIFLRAVEIFISFLWGQRLH